MKEIKGEAMEEREEEGEGFVRDDRLLMEYPCKTIGREEG